LIGNVLAELGFAKTGRAALLQAGFPHTTTFHTTNRQCSSSLQAITHISHAIRAGQLNVGLAGGVECMSRNYGSRGLPVDASPILKKSSNSDVRDCFMTMGTTSENVAELYGISRKMQDEYAFESHRRASKAQKSGYFDSEIVKFEVTSYDGLGDPIQVIAEKDEGIRHGLTLEKISSLKPVFKPDGRSTAGNSSQVSDGSAAVILARREWAEERGLNPLGRFIGTQVKGCAPGEMGISPVLAIPALFKKTGIWQQDVSIFELNEAFASQTVYCINKLGLHVDRVNPNGGAIALGHPTGATGARQTASLFAELKRTGEEIGMVSMCAR